jgi:hypothetical protein
MPGWLLLQPTGWAYAYRPMQLIERHEKLMRTELG